MVDGIHFPLTSRLRCSDEFGYWFSGFFDGEGSLTAKTSYTCKGTRRELKIQLSIRDDSGPVIDLIITNLGCGKTYPHHAKHTYKTTKPARMFRVIQVKDLAEIIVPLFEKYPLRTKKAQEYAIWKHLVLKRYTKQETRADFDAGAEQIQTLRVYREDGRS